MNQPPNIQGRFSPFPSASHHQQDANGEASGQAQIAKFKELALLLVVAVKSLMVYADQKG